MKSKTSSKVFEEQIFPLKGWLEKTALRFTTDKDEIDDLVQETLIKAYRFIDKFDPSTNVNTWLYTIMKNSFINVYRVKIKHEVYSLNQMQEDYAFDIPQETKKERLPMDVINALNNLSHQFRMAILLKYVIGYSYEEISKIMDIPKGTVRSSIFRAKETLREELL